MVIEHSGEYGISSLSLNLTLSLCFSFQQIFYTYLYRDQIIHQVRKRGSGTLELLLLSPGISCADGGLYERYENWHHDFIGIYGSISKGFVSF